MLARRVLEKIAGQAAGEVTGSSARRQGLLGLGALPGRAEPGRARVEVDLTSEYADLSLALGMPYPTSLRRTAAEVREHVGRRVEQLSGVPVRRVDVDISWLDLRSAAGR